MIRKSALFHFLLMVFTICLFEISLNSCASQSSPNGGPRDTIAPGLDTSFPANFTTNFNSNRIELIFDEYINLKNPGQQILISPLLKNKPEINLKGKTISIEFKDSLPFHLVILLPILGRAIPIKILNTFLAPEVLLIACHFPGTLRIH